ncbi:hypothetical protein OGAPHI_002130 [Ogataea philodendri]|uniref:Uncharacterized protein n=1 Tax=Ogataea philodendri TaxID=1378263 RepID=A0A9P8T7W1_9ASCO|nr:uncharacterized protein OGAPHI_002130 [Ogataea philodendri]KAH3668376.1 hypothetical protein OGAPHI_002130 [Ogataea philodendri]
MSSRVLHVSRCFTETLPKIVGEAEWIFISLCASFTMLVSPWIRSWSKISSIGVLRSIEIKNSASTRFTKVITMS